MYQLIEPHFQEIRPYVPGLSLLAMKKQFGLERFIKLGSNEGAYGPSPLAMSTIASALPNIHRYPNELRDHLKKQICAYVATPGIEPAHITLGNGSNEIISLLSRTFLGPGDILLNSWPSFIVYRLSAAAMKCREIAVPLASNLDFDTEAMIENANGKSAKDIKLLYLANPNNPTGRHISASEISRLVESIPKHILIVFDEAYFEYVNKQDYSTSISWVLKRPRTVVLRTFSKIFGLAGLRIGYGICDPEITRVLNHIEDPFNVNCLAQQAAISAIADQAHVAIGRANNNSQMIRMKDEISKLGLWSLDSSTNFLLIKLSDKIISSDWLSQEFLKRGVIVRTVNEYDLPRFIRVTIGQPDENSFFLEALTDILNHI